jgi:hypothetical protein
MRYITHNKTCFFQYPARYFAAFVIYYFLILAHIHHAKVYVSFFRLQIMCDVIEHKP